MRFKDAMVGAVPARWRQHVVKGLIFSSVINRGSLAPALKTKRPPDRQLMVFSNAIQRLSMKTSWLPSCRRRDLQNLVVAQQRVIQAYGGGIMKHSAIVNKGVDLADQWQSELEDIVAETDCSYCDAAQYLRKSRPSLFKAMRSD